MFKVEVYKYDARKAIKLEQKPLDTGVVLSVVDANFVVEVEDGTFINVPATQCRRVVEVEEKAAKSADPATSTKSAEPSIKK